MRLIGLALMLACSTGAAFADNWSKEWNVGQKPDLHVDTNDGRVELHSGVGNRIEARVTTFGWRISPSEVTIAERQSGDHVELTVKLPKRNFRVEFGNHSIVVEVRVPRDTTAHISTGDGSVNIEGVHGVVDASSGDGSIEAEGFDGTLTARTGDGHIRIRGRLDQLDVTTGDGSVEAECSTGSRMKSSWRVHTGDGHVTLRLPADFRADLDAHTGDGDIHVDLPITARGSAKPNDGDSNNKDLRGKMNGGGEILMIRTDDGAIRIERG